MLARLLEEAFSEQRQRIQRVASAHESRAWLCFAFVRSFSCWVERENAQSHLRCCRHSKEAFALSCSLCLLLLLNIALRQQQFRRPKRLRSRRRRPYCLLLAVHLFVVVGKHCKRTLAERMCASQRTHSCARAFGCEYKWFAQHTFAL